MIMTGLEAMLICAVIVIAMNYWERNQGK